MPKVGMEPIRREQIRKAAAKLISKQGFIRTTLADVAGAAKVSTGTINHYYGNKTDLLVDTLIYVSEANQAALRKQLDGLQDGLKKLRLLARTGAVVDKGFGRISAQIWAWAIAEAISSPQMSAVVQQRRASFQAIIEGVLRETEAGKRASDMAIRALAAELDSILSGLTIHIVSGGKLIDPQSVERSILALVEALPPSPGRAESLSQAPQRD